MNADFRLIHAVYLLLLSVWLGAMVMLVVSVTSAFAFLQNFDGVMLIAPAGWSDGLVDSNAEGFLASGFVGAMLSRLAVLQLICAAGLAVCVALQFLWFRPCLVAGAGAKRQGVRLFFLGVPLLIVLLNVLVLTPGSNHWRGPKFNPQTTPQQLDQAEERFALFQQLTTKTYAVATLMLAGALAMTPWCFREPPPPEASEEAASPKEKIPA